MEPDLTAPVRRSPTTWTMLALAAVVTALPVFSAVRSVLVAAGVVDVAPDDAFEGGLSAAGFFDERGVRIAEGFSAVVTIPVALTCIAVLAGLLLWKEWAREGALGVFGLAGLFLVVLGVNGLTSDPPARNAGAGLAAGLLVLTVTALVLSPAVRADFERKHLQRSLREREAAAAARRARLGG